jgi:hypothetical protein
LVLLPLWTNKAITFDCQVPSPSRNKIIAAYTPQQELMDWKSSGDQIIPGPAPKKLAMNAFAGVIALPEADEAQSANDFADFNIEGLELSASHCRTKLL